jgi:hypothetical protein
MHTLSEVYAYALGGVCIRSPEVYAYALGGACIRRTQAADGLDKLFARRA